MAGASRGQILHCIVHHNSHIAVILVLKASSSMKSSNYSVMEKSLLPIPTYSPSETSLYRKEPNLNNHAYPASKHQIARSTKIQI